MNILHVIPSVSLVQGGPSYAITRMESVLAQSGIKVTTLTSDDDGPGLRMGASKKACNKGVNRVFISKRSEFYTFAPGAIPWLWRNVTDFDIVHIHALFSFMSVAAALIARSRSVPYIIRPLGTLTEYGIQECRPWLKRLSLRWIESGLIRDASAVHFTSESEKHEAEGLGIPMRSVVFPLAVGVGEKTADSREFSLKILGLGSGLRLLFLSRIDPKKNVDGLLEAFALILKQKSDSWLLIAGDGEPAYVRQLKDSADSLGIAERVRWLGYVEGEYKASILKASDIFLLPSFSENFGIAAAEAMAAGLPVVLGQGVALANDVETACAGKITEPIAEAIAEVVIKLLEDPVLRKQMGKNARQLVLDRYSLDAMGGSLIEMYSNVLKKSVDNNC